ncbi:hypothetical protein EVAR_22191_1 [Eumeta japonica]|uniref:Uncharacterized protein n=1 Tax=Eumeta variegata TaxID=151549 RepID=A0A4C1UA96_EUMVA|nr:hypothetical protein EVAR_22191_1 [Eumeta japonica]
MIVNRVGKKNGQEHVGTCRLLDSEAVTTRKCTTDEKTRCVANRTLRPVVPLCCYALSLARSAQAERDNESCFFEGSGSKSEAETKRRTELKSSGGTDTAISSVTGIGIAGGLLSKAGPRSRSTTKVDVRGSDSLYDQAGEDAGRELGEGKAIFSEDEIDSS